MDGNPFTLLSSTPTENGFAARRGVLRTAPGEVQTFDEVSCVSGSYGMLRLQEFMQTFMNDE